MNKQLENLPYFKEPESQQEFDDGLKNFGRFGRLWQLALAKWLLTGQEKGYMQRGIYDRASELTGIQKKSLQNYANIYKSLKSSLRKEDLLSFSHYAEVSHLSGENQEYFLQQAVDNGWSVSTLKQQIKDHQIRKEQENRNQQKKNYSSQKPKDTYGKNSVSEENDIVSRKNFRQTKNNNELEGRNFHPNSPEPSDEIEPNNEFEEDTEEENQPIIYNEEANNLLSRFEDKSVDLLLTDPPYSTDIKDQFSAWVESWLYEALKKVKDTGRAYICIGAYPEEIYTYINSIKKDNSWIIDSPLIWTYRNALGQTPNMKYNLNYQMILHLYKATSAPLNNNITNEMFSVQDITAPDGRHGNRYFKWQKPDELADRLIYHSTNENDLIIDPFAGSGTFILKAAENNRKVFGSENNEEICKIAEQRGCVVQYTTTGQKI